MVLALPRRKQRLIQRLLLANKKEKKGRPRKRLPLIDIWRDKVNTIDRTVELKLANNPGHVLHYTVKSIVECEKELANHNLILTVASLAASPLSISDAYALLKWGLRGEKAYSDDDVDAVFMDCVEEMGVVALQTNIILALEKSGLIGKAKNKKALPQAKK